MSEKYLIRIEELVREGRSEREIERIVRRMVEDDVRALHDDLDESNDLRPAA